MSRSAVRTIRHGWGDPDYRPKAKPVPLTREEVAAIAIRNAAEQENFLRSQAASWGVAPEHVDMWINDPDAYRAVTAIKDREARVAVEGDTDLNHDNIEAAK